MNRNLSAFQFGPPEPEAPYGRPTESGDVVQMMSGACTRGEHEACKGQGMCDCPHHGAN